MENTYVSNIIISKHKFLVVKYTPVGHGLLNFASHQPFADKLITLDNRMPEQIKMFFFYFINTFYIYVK